MKRAADMMQPSTTTKRIHASPPPLPEDMLIEILARLPAKSAARFRCLSRSWAATLSSASFIAFHLQQANSGSRRAGPPKLFFTTTQQQLHAWRCGDGPVEQLTGVLPLPQLDLYCAVQVLTKPCHGLVLLRRWPFHGHYVCNPSTGALLPLPGTKVHELNNTYGKTVSYGLGYCSTTKQHKVVRLSSLGDAAATPTTSSTLTTTCEVFSLDVSAQWRPAAQQPYPCTMRDWTAAVFFNGYLHFLQHKDGGGDGGIVTFDICRETFGSLLLPPSSGLPPDNNDAALKLTVLDGCLCVYHELPLSDDPYYIWLLRHYEAGQWEQLCCIRREAWPEAERSLLRPTLISPLEVYRGANGQKKIMFSSELVVFEVDLDGGGAPPDILLSPPEMMQHFIEHRNSLHTTVGLLEESLVSVGRTSEEIVFSSPSRKAWSHVLKWMPASSIAPLKRVCRDWNAVINSDRFMQLHTLHAHLGKSPRIMLITTHYGLEFQPLQACGYCGVMKQHHEMGDFMDWFLFGEGRSRVVCSKPCHGLVAGSCTSNEGISWDFVCNPVMRYNNNRCITDTYFDDDILFAGRLGLGYDLRTNKHVLVRLVYQDRNLNTREYKLECYLHLTGTGLWISISPPPRPVADMQPAYADGKLYWIVDPNLGSTKSSRCEIVALDCGTMEFKVLQGPHCNHNQIKSIIELQGNICILCSDRCTNTLNIWAMDGDGWSIGRQIELGEFPQEYPSDETVPLVVDPKDGRVLISTGRALGYYDPKTKKLDTIYCLGEHRPGMKFVPIFCYETLISPYICV